MKQKKFFDVIPISQTNKLGRIIQDLNAVFNATLFLKMVLCFNPTNEIQLFNSCLNHFHSHLSLPVKVFA